ncbi:MAG: sigma-54-dependent Fis family transcriptional regulator [Pirellulaceae bacterium]
MPQDPLSLSIVVELLEAAATCTESAEFLGQVLGRWCGQLHLDAAVVVTFDRGQWRREAGGGERLALPYELLADALDADHTLVREGWVAAPVLRASSAAAVLALHCAAHRALELEPEVTRLAVWLATGWRSVGERSRQQRRVARLEAMLGISAQWGQAPEMDKLLEEMAEASTRLLDAERASVFLWDRDTQTLVGRPSLGVEGGELRIPENTGIVGQVIRSGEPRRVDRESGQQEIDRRVDQQLGFQTRTLLCVPMRGRGGKLFGAFELINKRTGNFTDEDQAAVMELAAHAAGVLENTRQYEQLLKTRNQIVDDAAAGVQLVGQCPAIQALRSTVARVADTELAVLVLGENGTGKEVVARCVHYLSRRRHEPFIAVNCAALTETLLESELFGHEKGAFTDAHERRSGKFELASGGTLFLDEIGDMSLGGQAKLLRVLEEKLVVRVGGSTPIHTNARVLAATNQHLVELVRHKKFREDLYFRLNVVTLELPPLRDRGEDILMLAEQFLTEFSRQARRKPPDLTAAARKRLLGHAWPGNVRELRNLMERMVYLTSDDKVDADELAFIMSPRGDDSAWLASDLTLAEATHQFQVQFIQKQVQRAQGNMTNAAERLGLHRANLYRKMRQLDMESP